MGTWLYHEIAKCHLEMKSYTEAKTFGHKSLECATESGDEAWQLNSTIIIAKAETKLEDYEAAANTFGEALEIAKSQQNTQAQESIEKALRDVNEKLSRNVVQQVSSHTVEDQNYKNNKQLEESGDKQQGQQQRKSPEVEQ